MGLTERSFLERMELMGFTPTRTNADRIRAMSDEELAEFLTSEHFVDVLWCSRWLKSPVEVGNGT